MKLPNFIGIGAPKAGTTWLAKCLGEHPDVYMPIAKELTFFDYGDFDDRLDDYLAHFKGVKNETAIGEFTTRYLASRRPAPRISKMIPSAKIILCLRNPVDQIYSHYWHLARQNFHQSEIQPETSFEKAIEKFSDLLLPSARYWEHLQYWLTFFPREQVLVLLYDDIASDPASVLRRTFEFVGVQPDFTPASTTNRGADVRAGTSPRSALAKRVYSSAYAALNHGVYVPLKRWIGMHRASQLKESFRARQWMEWMFFKSGYPKMAPATRKALAAQFRPEVDGIETFLGRRLESWS